MALLDDKPRVLAALEQIPGVTEALPAWPKDFARVPVIVVTEAGQEVADRRDDRRYLQQLEYYVRVFAKGTAQLTRIADAADDVMTELGYELTFAWEDDSAEVRQKVLRYRITM